MNYKAEFEQAGLDMSGINNSLFLIRILSAFDNRYQATADNFFEEISWKQFFAIICINMCKMPPSLKELAELMGSSHQNVKQILLKLEKKGYVEFLPDEKDKRKQRVVITEKTLAFCAEHEEGSSRVIQTLFRGIDPAELEATIRTIMKMDENLREVKIR